MYKNNFIISESEKNKILRMYNIISEETKNAKYAKNTKLRKKNIELILSITDIITDGENQRYKTVMSWVNNGVFDEMNPYEPEISVIDNDVEYEVITDDVYNQLLTEFQKNKKAEQKKTEPETTTKGPCNGDCVNGEGELTLKNGSIYRGKFLNSKYDGKGVFEDKVRGFIYSGFFKNGEMDGKGSVKFNNDTKYIGMFKSVNNLNTITYSDLKGMSIPDLISHHTKLNMDKNREVVEFNLTGEVYELNELQTKIPIKDVTISLTKKQNNLITNNVKNFTVDENGKFQIKVERGNYKMNVTPTINLFLPIEIEDIKIFNDVNKNIVLERNKKIKKVKEVKKSKDLIETGALTIYETPNNDENKVYKKSKTKEEYCMRFTNYYYQTVIEGGGKLASLNQNNLTNSKNFIINCYKEYNKKYDKNLKSKINQLTNLGGNVEVFEL